VAGRVDGRAYPSDLTDAEYAVPARWGWGRAGAATLQPRRRVVERTSAWLGHARRLSKEYERLCATSEALVLAAMTRLLARRLARL
jgi:transposase